MSYFLLISPQNSSPDFLTNSRTTYSNAAETFRPDFAEVLTERDCKLSNIVCYHQEVENGTTVLSYTEEAQDIFNEYYDAEIDRLYYLFNNCLKIHES